MTDSRGAGSPATSSLTAGRPPTPSQHAGLYLAFAGLGATAAVVPAALPSLAEVLAADTAALVWAVPALFGGLFLGVALVAGGAGRQHPGRALRIGAAAQASGLVLVSASWSASAVVGAAWVAGLGFGVAEASGATLARHVGTHGAGHSLLGLTAATAATAALTPLAVLFAGTSHVREVLLAAAVPHVLAALAVSGQRRLGSTTSSLPHTGSSRARSWWVAAALFCYVGSETIVAGWSAVLPREMLALSPADAAAGTSVFWLLLMVGRIGGSIVISRGSRPRTVVTVCQIGAGIALAASAATAASEAATSVVLFAAAAAFMGPCYALLLGQALEGVAAAEAGRLSAALICAGALGGVAWTAAVGGFTHGGRGVVAGGACLAIVTSALAARRCSAR